MKRTLLLLVSVIILMCMTVLTAYGFETSSVPVAEPATLVILGTGLICLAGFIRKS